jgi:tricarballylate dehydrogenase
VYDGLEDIRKIVPDLTEGEIATTDFGAYSAEDYFDDLGRATQYQTDPELAELLVRRSTESILWLREKGIRFEVSYGHQAMKHGGRFKFNSGVVLNAAGGGRGLVDDEFRIAEKHGIGIRYNAQATALLRGRSGIEGVRALVNGVEEEIRSKAVVLATGGFESNREWRARYLGPGWDMAKVRGTRYNTGDGIRMALDVGAQPFGQWSGCHAVAWDRYAPDFGYVDENGVDLKWERHSFCFCVYVNADGDRFIDEGANFRNLVVAKQGRVVMEQPGSYAWQVFDAPGMALTRDAYRQRGTKAKADTLEELAERMGDVNPERFLETIRSYNASIKREVPFNPNIKDGRCTVGLPINKSNWANPIEVPPFEAYSVGAGVTFTFGGVKTNPKSCVLDMEDMPIPGLYAAGELVGGLFYFNYPGGGGLMAGAVFGRNAGDEAANYAMTCR